VHIVIASLIPDVPISTEPLVKRLELELFVPELPEYADIFLVRNHASLESLL
jgi:hypothetical protein